MNIILLYRDLKIIIKKTFWNNFYFLVSDFHFLAALHTPHGASDGGLGPVCWDRGSDVSGGLTATDSLQSPRTRPHQHHRQTDRQTDR